MEEATLQEILEGTVAVARGLEALQNEHESIITENVDNPEGIVYCQLSQFAHVTHGLCTHSR